LHVVDLIYHLTEFQFNIQFVGKISDNTAVSACTALNVLHQHFKMAHFLTLKSCTKFLERTPIISQNNTNSLKFIKQKERVSCEVGTEGTYKMYFVLGSLKQSKG